MYVKRSPAVEVWHGHADRGGFALSACPVAFTHEESNHERFEIQALLLSVGLMMGRGAALAQQGRGDAGKREFAENCARCHGDDDKGNGPRGNLLQRSPP